jgi:hypothetical protein
MPAGTSGLAIASLVLGIAGLCTGIAAIGAVITGHMALGRINQSNGVLQGRGLAIAGLILGYIEIVFLAIFIILIVIGAMSGGVTSTP